MRHTFDSAKELERWVDDFVKARGRYAAFRSHQGEFVLRPIVNPRDNDYIYFKSHDATEADKIEKFLDSKSIEVYHPKESEWRVDQ